MVRLNEYIIQKLRLYKVISEDEVEIYKFGIECFILKLIHCISYIGIALCLGMLPELLVIGGVLIPLRRSAGGFHAKTKAGCYIFSCFYVLLLLLISKAAIIQWAWWGALVLADGIIFFMSPADNDNKKLDILEIQHYRKKSRYILLAVNIGCIVLFMLSFNKIGQLLCCGICAAAFLLIFHKATTLTQNSHLFKALDALKNSNS